MKTLDRLYFNRSERSKLVFSGPQALWFLDQLFTNKIDDLRDGASSETMLLDHRGRIKAHGFVFFSGGRAYFDFVALSLNVFDFLTSRIFATKVEIEDVSAEFSVVDMYSFEVPGQLDSVKGLIRKTSDSAITSWVPNSDREFFERLHDSGFQAGNNEEDDALRIQEGIVRLGIDFDDSYLPQEAALEGAVHFSKGCYLGQEAVAMAQRGRVKRKVRRLVFEAASLLGEVQFEGENVGKVTTTSPLLNSAIATIGTKVPVGTRVQVRQGQRVTEAIVETLPGTTSGPEVPSARELREKLESGEMFT